MWYDYIMLVSMSAKTIVIHISRGLAYATFPIGAFLFSLFVLTASEHSLDFSTFANVLLNISAIFLFFIPPIIILFLHPVSKHSNAGIQQSTDQARVAKIEKYLPHVFIIIILAGIGVVAFFLSVIFMGAVSGA